MFLGAIVSIVCCPTEIGNDVFCNMVVGQKNDEWLSKTPLRLARLQINDVISEALLDGKFCVEKQFRSDDELSFDEQLAQWCRGFLKANEIVDELWEKDFLLLARVCPVDELTRAKKLRSECRELMQSMLDDTEVASAKSDSLSALDAALNRLHSEVLIWERHKINYKFE